jgi:uncharacterized Zn-binding protein involved in type VI secretion
MPYTSIPSSDQTFIAQTRKGDKVQCKQQNQQNQQNQLHQLRDEPSSGTA